MSKLAYWISRGPHPSASALQHASPQAEFNRARIIPDEVHPEPAIESIGTKTRTLTESLPVVVAEQTDQITAFYHEHVPIPWFHGDQRMSG